VNFEEVQKANKDYLIINTMPSTDQDCLIKGTMAIAQEEAKINELLNRYDSAPLPKIIVYGRNSHDNTVDKKYKQLRGLGLTDVYVYSGGLFEWLLLQDIYGNDEFPTTKRVIDILRYK
jgi:hypothetical protein